MSTREQCHIWGITHSYEGLGLGYSMARTEIRAFASFIVSHVMPDINDLSFPLTIIELGVGSGQQTEFVEKELNSNGLIQYKILAYYKSCHRNLRKSQDN